MIFERTPREQALEEIRDALREERLNEADAETLAAVASDYDVPIELLVRCIHEAKPASRSVLVAFTRFAVEYRREGHVDERQAELFPHAPEAFD
jgi:hypothetical protein